VWIKNTSTRTQGKNYASQHNYIVVNITQGNPALRVSEKARQELGWDEKDFVNVYCDREKIMIMKDNITKEFPVRLYKSANKLLGMNVYSKSLKEAMESMDWENKEYEVEIHDNGKEKMIICFKNRLDLDIEKALRTRRVKSV
jgi:bifunctional DNA-binding transcriptional regulator/antitoxin component of YhaV-PrlF toxin-antitoxin module